MKKIPCEIFTRVCGFYRPVSQFNKGKYEEFLNRVYFDNNLNEYSMDYLTKE